MSGDPLHTRLCEEYGCEVPIVAFAHTKDVIVAVVNAGGIGVLGGIAMTPDQLRSDIQWIRERVGDKAFGIHLVIPAPFVQGNPEDLDAPTPPQPRDSAPPRQAEGTDAPADRLPLGDAHLALFQTDGARPRTRRGQDEGASARRR